MAAGTKEIVKDVCKTGGSIGIYIGTASIIKPIIKQHDVERNALGKVCASAAGTVISCGVSYYASKWWEKIVDKVSDFVDSLT